MKLLLVEPDAAYAKRVQLDLLRHNAVLCDLARVPALDGALSRLSDDTFDAIVLDVPTIDADALKTCSKLCLAAPESPLIVLTDCRSDAAAVETIVAGAQDCLVRDELETRWLLTRVRYGLERRKFLTRCRKNIATHVRRPARAAALVGAGAGVGTGSARSARRPSQTAVREPSSSHSPFQLPVIKRLMETSGRPFRLLHVEDDPLTLHLLKHRLQQSAPALFHVDEARTLDAALSLLEEDAFDAVVLDLTLPDSAGLDTFLSVLPLVNDAAIIVFTSRDDAAAAVEAMQLGAQDFLIKSQASVNYLPRAARLAVARQALRGVQVDLRDSRVTARPRTQPAILTSGHNDRRNQSRYLLTRPILTIPILPDGSPATTHEAIGFSWDISVAGLRIEIPRMDKLPSSRMLVGVEAQDGLHHFATVEIRHSQPTDSGIVVGAQFTPDERELLRRDNLMPRLVQEKVRFATGLPHEVLEQWVELGVLRPVLVDRVYVCPQCRSAPTFRQGCRACGSVRVATSQLIHHFACAHVALIEDFERDGAVGCPKCRTRDLVVGADFEYLNGPYHCLECDWTDSELEFVGQCLRCELRFPIQRACEEELIGYHVHRLDPLALIDAA